MRFVFDEEKAAQAAGYLLNKYPRKRHSVLAIMKMLYLADRQSLIETGRTITGDRMVSMPHGPVLSQVLDCINHGPVGDNSPWYAAITPRTGNNIQIANDLGIDALSEYETDILDRVYEDYGQMHPLALRDLTHRLPEWENPEGSSLPIDPVHILRIAGIPDEDIRHIIEENEQRYSLRAFGR